MKINAVRRCFQNQPTFNTLKHLNFILSIFGLSCIYLDGSRLKFSFPLMKHVFLMALFGVINVINMFHKVMLMEGRITFTFVESLQIIFLFGFIQYIIDVYCVYKYGKSKSLVYFSIFDYIDRILYMNIHYNVIRVTITKLMISIISGVVCSCVFDFTSWYVVWATKFHFMHFFDYMYVLLRALSAADHISQIIQIEYRLKTMRNILNDYYATLETLPGVIKDVINNDKSRTNVANVFKGIHVITTVNDNDSTVIKLADCYLLLLEQCDYINTMYGIRIMGICFTILIDVIMLLNLAIRLMVGTIVLPDIGYYSVLPIVSSYLRLLACGFVLMCGMGRCEQVYKESVKIIRIIDYLQNNKKLSTDVQQSLKNLRALLTARPIEFHANNFFKLDNKLMLSVISVVVTYTIIFLQNMK